MMYVHSFRDVAAPFWNLSTGNSSNPTDDIAACIRTALRTALAAVMFFVTLELSRISWKTISASERTVMDYSNWMAILGALSLFSSQIDGQSATLAAIIAATYRVVLLVMHIEKIPNFSHICASAIFLTIIHFGMKKLSDPNYRSGFYSQSIDDFALNAAPTLAKIFQY